MATKTTTRKEELRKPTSVKTCAPRRRLLSLTHFASLRPFDFPLLDGDLFVHPL